ncbi:MAG TPA: bifunctional oligoribonuclease/PAP phosphatase NrnA [Armatimonadota bacterium]|jgi:phosphoesterase RecJ-like protein
MPSDPTLLRQAADAILGAECITLACHINPDGDAFGSMLALALALEGIGKKVVRLCQDPVPMNYRFMAGAESVAKHPPTGWMPQVSVGLDCDAEHRLGTIAPFVFAAPCVVDLDHHTGSGPFGHIRVLDSGASSTSQVVYELLPFLGVGLNRDIATCLLAGIIFDTGAFRFSNTSPATFEAAATLVNAGADPDAIHQAMFDNRPFSNVKLLGRALINALSDGSVAWSALTRKDFRETGAEETETEGVVNNLMAIRDIRAAALFRETAHGVKVSLRSRNGIDVAEIARHFGGGGHVKAAGCTVQKPMAEAMAEVLGLMKLEAGKGQTG